MAATLPTTTVPISVSWIKMYVEIYFWPLVKLSTHSTHMIQCGPTCLDLSLHGTGPRIGPLHNWAQKPNYRAHAARGRILVIMSSFSIPVPRTISILWLTRVRSGSGSTLKNEVFGSGNTSRCMRSSSRWVNVRVVCAYRQHFFPNHEKQIEPSALGGPLGRWVRCFRPTTQHLAVAFLFQFIGAVRQQQAAQAFGSWSDRPGPAPGSLLLIKGPLQLRVGS